MYRSCLYCTLTEARGKAGLYNLAVLYHWWYNYIGNWICQCHNNYNYNMHCWVIANKALVL